MTLTPASARISTSVQPRLVEAGSAGLVPRSRAGLAVSGALHLVVVAAVLRLGVHLPVPPAAPATFDVVFRATPERAPPIVPDLHPALPAAPAAATPVPPAPDLPPAATRPAAHITRASPRAAVAIPGRPRVVTPHHPVPISGPVSATEPHRLAVMAAPPGEAPRPAAPPVAAPDPAAVAALEARIDQAVNAAKAYPDVARRLRVQGRSEVSFAYRDGVVSGLTLAKSSTHDPLDRAALEAVRRAAYPTPPPALAHHVLQLAVWLDFSLRQGDW